MSAYTELVDFTFTADETSRAFTGLNITEDDFIKIVITHVNGSSSACDIRCFPNTTASVSGFDTNANYHNQVLAAGGGTVAAARENNNRLTRTAGSETGASISYFKISENGKTNTFTNRFGILTSDVDINFNYTTSSNLTFNDPITSLTFTASETDGLGDGSRIQIYRLDAVKEADITVASDTTQVDIPVTGSLDPAINKDSEYLLVADWSPVSGGELRISPNDLTTNTGYYVQRIGGINNTAFSDRDNNNSMVNSSTTLKSMAYAHIKLSEIGAFTVQSYTMRAYGTGNDFHLVNRFISSTSEAITSITKLNLVASVTDGIATGSRFILYKLK